MSQYWRLKSKKIEQELSARSPQKKEEQDQDEKPEDIEEAGEEYYGN